MAKKVRRMRTFARTASKSMEKNLVENAKKLKENPYLIFPEYSDKYSKKYFGKIKKTIDKTTKFFDDAKKLEKFANKKTLDGALAGTLLLAHTKKAPYLAVAKFSFGDVTYAQRGKAGKEKLIAVQHFDNPVLRLFGIKEISMKKKLHVYSWDNGFFSSGIEAKPPKEFVDFIIKKVGFSIKDGISSCGHISAKEIKEKSSASQYYLMIFWKSADVLFVICENCAKSTKNTMFKITKYLISSKIASDFSIDVVGKVFEKEAEQKTLFIDEYLSGDITDFELIKKNKEEREESVRASNEKILVLDDESFGTDVESFIDALEPNEFERMGLEFILEKVEEPIVLKNVTPNKVLEIYWRTYGVAAIDSIVQNEKLSEKFFSLDDIPANILQLVSNYKKRQKILSKLPSYEDLPPLSNFADHMARTYKTFGEKKTIQEIKRRPDSTKGKALAYAFLLCFHKGKDKKWKYSQVELEYGEFLKEYTKKLLESTPEGYHEALKELITASGSSENVDNFTLRE